MLRSIFGKKESDTMAEKAATIDAKSFKAALDRYPALIKSITKPRKCHFVFSRLGCGISEPLFTRLIAKEGHLSLEELDDFRYNGAPMAYSLKTGRTMESSDVAKLVEWKM
jgi:hypothetical protein